MKTRPETYEWLMAKTRLGRRIDRLGWRRLARRCGCTPSEILALHAE